MIPPNSKGRNLGKIYIGTSGFTYKSWNAAFYPKDLVKRLQLEFYASQFPTVEINATFYRLPSEKMVRGWADRVPREFKYALKGSRFITHMKKLANLGDGLDNYFQRIRPMKSSIGVILWQLPPMLQKDLPRLEAFLSDVRPYGYRHAVEFRHQSWYENNEAFDLLRRHKASHVSLSTLNMPMNLTVTSDLVYIRFHGLKGGFAHDYTREELAPWARFCSEQSREGRTVYAYFNNDVNVRAPENARMLMEMSGSNVCRASGKVPLSMPRKKTA